jgi:uncharacterized protein (TIGR03083 family)
MSATTATPAKTAPRTPGLDRDVAMRLAAEEYERFVAQLRELAVGEWSRPTACPDWDVHAMACHVLGMAEFVASMPEQLRQMRAARKAAADRDGLFIDALTALQVSKHVHRSPARVVELLAATGPKAARGRKRVPALMRRMPMKDQPVDETGAQTETWTMGYLIDVILTRDTWMHRSDIAAAVGRPMHLTAGHDGVLVADVVADWAQRHAQACSLTLTGPAGGAWTFGSGGPSYELDAVEFCRIVCGRGTGDGLLATRVPF